MSDSDRGTRRLLRRTDDKVIAGVCAGLGDYFGVDPLLFRIAFVLLGLTGLTGIVLYVLAWAFIPPATAPRDQASPSRSGTPWLAIALFVAAALLVLPMLLGMLMGIFHGGPFGGFGGPPFPFFEFFSPGPFVIAALLVLVGVVLLRPSEARLPGAAPVTAAPADPTQPQSATAIQQRPLPRRPRERSALTALTVAAALLLVGIAASLSNLGAISLDVGQLSALGLLVVGIGLIVGAWYGRGRLLIALGLLALPIVLVTSLIDFPLSGDIGSHYIAVTRPSDLRDLRYVAGDVTLDLREYEFEAGTNELEVRIGTGQLTVMVPRAAFVEAEVTAGAGEAHVLGTYDDGFGVDLATSGGPPDATDRLDLDVRAGFASVNVYRVGNGHEGRYHPEHERKGKEREIRRLR